ncbi:MAG: hypothetical protein QXX20_01640 [Candidatus Thermoplasmatota archaeon]
MPSKRFVEKKQQKKIAHHRICYLFDLAEKNARDNKFDLANRYVHLARRVGMRYRVPIPAQYKRCYCKHCETYILPGTTGRIRIHHGKIIIFCTGCNCYTRVIIPKNNK